MLIIQILISCCLTENLRGPKWSEWPSNAQLSGHSTIIQSCRPGAGRAWGEHLPPRLPGRCRPGGSPGAAVGGCDGCGGVPRHCVSHLRGHSPVPPPGLYQLAGPLHRADRPQLLSPPPLARLSRQSRSAGAVQRTAGRTVLRRGNSLQTVPPAQPQLYPTVLSAWLAWLRRRVQPGFPVLQLDSGGGELDSVERKLDRTGTGGTSGMAARMPTRHTGSTLTNNWGTHLMSPYNLALNFVLRPEKFQYIFFWPTGPLCICSVT